MVSSIFRTLFTKAKYAGAIKRSPALRGLSAQRGNITGVRREVENGVEGLFVSFAKGDPQFVPGAAVGPGVAAAAGRLGSQGLDEAATLSGLMKSRQLSGARVGGGVVLGTALAEMVGSRLEQGEEEAELAAEQGRNAYRFSELQRLAQENSARLSTMDPQLANNLRAGRRLPPGTLVFGTTQGTMLEEALFRMIYTGQAGASVQGDLIQTGQTPGGLQ